ncbi:MAG TPA: hypothetical protein VKP65_05160 [Rhodothermales bacterium]|nr:hypothetical protein [Rhodothermales bacterium]
MRWAYRIFLTIDVSDEIKLERIRLTYRTLPALRRRMLKSRELDRERHRQRADATPLDTTLVQWCYRLLRFEVISPDMAQRIATEQGTLLSLVEALLNMPDHDENLADVAPHNADHVSRLYAKSMPRSGHHLLTNLLCEYFGTALHYCEFYTGGDTCCHALPCHRVFHPLLQNHLFLQKSHDFGFSDPIDLPGKYLVQYRHPIPRLQSIFDHHTSVTEKTDSEDHFQKFAWSQTRYFIRFWKKWIQPSQPNLFLLSYEELIEEPREMLVQLLSFIQDDDTIDETALARTLQMIRVPSGSTKQRGVFTRRNIESYRYFDEQLYHDIEKTVFEACSGLSLERIFSK